MHTIDEVLWPWNPSELAHQEPMSVKKMMKGDASWQPTSSFLAGSSTQLTKPFCCHLIVKNAFLHAIFKEFRGRRRVALKQWHKVLGELRSMVMAIPGSRGLFSTLQAGLQHTDKHRVRISPVIGPSWKTLSCSPMILRVVLPALLKSSLTTLLLSEHAMPRGKEWEVYGSLENMRR